MKLFGEKAIEEMVNIRGLFEEIDRQINALPRETVIDDVKSHSAAENILKRLCIDSLVLDTENYSISPTEVDVPADQFPSNYNVTKGRSYRKPAVTVHLKCSGNKQLLSARTQFDNPYIEATQSSDEVLFNVVDFDYTPEELKAKIEREVSNAERSYKSICDFVDGQNRGFRNQVSEKLKKKKQDYLAQNDKIASLGLSIKKQS